MTLPNFLILGAMKGGTTSLYGYLSRHPDVFMSRVKEPHYFSGVTDPVLPTVRSPEAYERLFAGAGDARAIGEASASYLWSRRAAERIARELPGARLIAVLREPVSRAHSHYLMAVRNGLEERPFGEAIEADYALGDREWGEKHLYVELGQYAGQVARYLELVGSDRLFVTTSDQLKHEPIATLRSICEFLDIDAAPVADWSTEKEYYAFGMPRGATSRWLTSSMMVRRLARSLIPWQARQFVLDRFLLRDKAKPAIDPRAAAWLARLYEPDVVRLESLLGRSLPELRRTWPSPAPSSHRSPA